MISKISSNLNYSIMCQLLRHQSIYRNKMSYGCLITEKCSDFDEKPTKCQGAKEKI